MIIGLLALVLALLPTHAGFDSWWQTLIDTHDARSLCMWTSYLAVVASYFPFGLAFLIMEMSGWMRQAKTTKQQPKQ